MKLRIKIIVDDWYLKNWYGIKNLQKYDVVEVAKDGYWIIGKVLYDSNSKGKASKVFIKKKECRLIKPIYND